MNNHDPFQKMLVSRTNYPVYLFFISGVSEYFPEYLITSQTAGMMPCEYITTNK